MRLMKHALLTFFALAAVTLAQAPQTSLPSVPPPAPDVRRTRVINPSGSQSSVDLPENYILTLTVAVKDKPASEISLVVASTNFTVSVPLMNFQGTISAGEDGSFLVQYSLNISNIDASAQHQMVATAAAVRLRVDEPVQIYKSEERSYKMALTRLADQAKKK